MQRSMQNRQGITILVKQGSQRKSCLCAVGVESVCLLCSASCSKSLDNIIAGLIILSP